MASPGEGCSGSMLSCSDQTLFSYGSDRSPFWGSLNVPKPATRYYPSSRSWVCPVKCGQASTIAAVTCKKFFFFVLQNSDDSQKHCSAKITLTIRESVLGYKRGVSFPKVSQLEDREAASFMNIKGPHPAILHLRNSCAGTVFLCTACAFTG